MKKNGYKSRIKGFTLIELLVVVLIIGILAAIALPQYQKAVTRAKSAELFTIMDAVAKDAQAYLYREGDLNQFSAMQDSSTGMVDWSSWTFGKNFQIGSDNSRNQIPERFYCVSPRNGDKAAIYHFIDNTGKQTRICAGDDCDKYVRNASCFSSVGDNCSSAQQARSSGCSF